MDNRPAVGSLGRALDKLDPSGQVEILGAAYAARTAGETIDPGRNILVTGFDPLGLLVREASLADVAPAQLRPSPPTENSGWTLGDSFLLAGAAISLLGCAFAIVTTLYGLWTMTQVFLLVPVSTGDSTLLFGMVLLNGVVEFCFFAALLVVFMRVFRLK
jgi:hypothetical protein